MQWKVWLFIQTFHCVFLYIHRQSSSFSALWIYTILKLRPIKQPSVECFTTLWIYTILKPYHFLWQTGQSFTTLWIYTILKQLEVWNPVQVVSLPYGFTLFSNRWGGADEGGRVSLPYGFTLFSNIMTEVLNLIAVSLPYGFTLFSNAGGSYLTKSYVSLPYGFTLFSNFSEAVNKTLSFHYLMDLHYSQTRITVVHY